MNFEKKRWELLLLFFLLSSVWILISFELLLLKIQEEVFHHFYQFLSDMPEMRRVQKLDIFLPHFQVRWNILILAENTKHGWYRRKLAGPIF